MNWVRQVWVSMVVIVALIGPPAAVYLAVSVTCDRHTALMAMPVAAPMWMLALYLLFKRKDGKRTAVAHRIATLFDTPK